MEGGGDGCRVALVLDSIDVGGAAFEGHDPAVSDVGLNEGWILRNGARQQYNKQPLKHIIIQILQLKHKLHNTSLTHSL